MSHPNAHRIQAGLAVTPSGSTGIFPPRQYHSYSGTDMMCMLHMPGHTQKEQMRAGVLPQDASDYAQKNATTKIFAELATLSISSARSVHPVRRLGESHVYDYTRGARTVAGTMVFALLDRDVFAEVYRSNPMELQSSAPFYVDQIPKFNIYIAGGNEYGGLGAEALIGITLTNVGKTWSVDDIYTECTYTYVAQYWMPFVENYEAFNRIVDLNTNESAAARSVGQIINEQGQSVNSKDKIEEAQLDQAVKTTRRIIQNSR